jgi:small subunit ribosomal protein S17
MNTLTGKVVSTKMQKTIVVEIERSFLHPLYKKYMKKFNRLKVHSDVSEVKVGDTVSICETRPLSKEKHFKLVQIIK